MKELPRKYSSKIVGAILFTGLLGVYVSTMSASVGYIDSGELATASYILGIPHPTGYPLFVIIGKVFTSLPIFTEMIVRYNFLSAVSVSLAMVILFYTCMQLLGTYRFSVRLIASALASASLGITGVVWDQATLVEVYSLHLFLLMGILFNAIYAVRAGNGNILMLSVFLLGLSFSNHMTTVLLVPGLIYFISTEIGIKKFFLSYGMASAIFFGLGLSVYLFLPVRSAAQPILDWGNPETFERFISHVTGKQFRVWMFSSPEVAARQFSYFMETLPVTMHYIPVILAAVGAIFTFRRQKHLSIFILNTFVVCIAYSINYDIHDIDSYFLLSYICITLFMAMGVAYILENLHDRMIRIAGIVGAILIIIGILRSWEQRDVSLQRLPEEYTLNLLRELPQNAIIISYQWDYFISPSYYYQYVRSIRDDVVIIDKELLRRSWYFEQLKRNHPDVYERSKNEIQLFMKELVKFENDMPYDFQTIEARYTDVINSFILKNIESRRCFITSEIEPQYTAGAERVPFGLSYELIFDKKYFHKELPQYIFSSIGGPDKYSRNLRMIISNSLLQMCIFEINAGNQANAAYYIGKSDLFRR